VRFFFWEDTTMYAFESDGTDGGIAMRATLRGRDSTLVGMVLGDRRDARAMQRFAECFRSAYETREWQWLLAFGPELI
jgi:hypothetical protein